MEYHYKMIGADGREYGPVTLDEVIRWAQEGRIAPSTQIWRNDTTLWTAANQYEELQAHLPIVSTPQPAAYSSMALKPAGFWIRLGAFFLDYLLLNVVMRLVFNSSYELLKFNLQRLDALAKMHETDLPLMLDTGRLVLLIFTGYAIISIFYYVLMNGRYGATLGKLAVGVKIVNLDGSPIGYRRAFTRYSADVLNVLTLYLSYLMVAFREDKRGLHDLIAKTRVVFRD